MTQTFFYFDDTTAKNIANGRVNRTLCRGIYDGDNTEVQLSIVGYATLDSLGNLFLSRVSLRSIATYFFHMLRRTSECSDIEAFTRRVFLTSDDDLRYDALTQLQTSLFIHQYYADRITRTISENMLFIHKIVANIFKDKCREID